jgi:hypothetical protein
MRTFDLNHMNGPRHVRHNVVVIGNGTVGLSRRLIGSRIGDRHCLRVRDQPAQEQKRGPPNDGRAYGPSSRRSDRYTIPGYFSSHLPRGVRLDPQPPRLTFSLWISVEFPFQISTSRAKHQGGEVKKQIEGVSVFLLPVFKCGGVVITSVVGDNHHLFPIAPPTQQRFKKGRKTPPGCRLHSAFDLGG